MRSGSVNSVTAGTATIGHKPYQLQSLGITDIDTQGKAYSTSMSRSDLSKLSVAKLASSANQLMGLVPKFGADEPGLDPDDIAELTALTYSNLLNDKYAKPLYPPSGLKSMMADAQLTQKLALVNRARFAGSAALAIKLCSSSSTSSNACTSTSSSCIEL